MTEICVPAQRVTPGTGFITGTAFTIVLNVIGVPVQPFSEGVTVTRPVCVVGLGVVVTAISPDPVADMPVAGLLFVQL